MVESHLIAIKHIEKTPGVLGGRARIAGRRIGVERIVEAYEHAGITPAEIAARYRLTLAQVYAALAYYHDHRGEIEAVLEADSSALPEDAAQSGQTLRALWRSRQPADPDTEMTASELAARYGISARAVRKACAEARLPARKSGSTWLIRLRDAEARWGAR